MRMRGKRMSIRRTIYTIALIFGLLGAIFTAIGVGAVIESVNFNKTARETTALITNIEYYNYRSGGKSKTGHHVWVKYYVDDREYNTMLNEYSSSMREGREIDVKYDPEHPENVRTNMYVFQIVYLSVGFLFLAIGIAFIAVDRVKTSRRKALMENGDALRGVITDIRMNKSLKINGRHPYKAECEVIDSDGEKYLYSSENFTDSMGMFGDLSSFIGRDVTVYADRNDRSKYYVDIIELFGRYESDESVHDYR